MPPRSSVALITAAMLALAGCGDGPRAQAPARPAPAASTPAVAPATATTSPPSDPALVDDYVDLMVAAYRFELALHAGDAERAVFGGYFLDYPPELEQRFLEAFAGGSPRVHQRRWLHFTTGQAVIDLMTGKPGISFVAEVRGIRDDKALLHVSWWSDPELAGGVLMGMQRTRGGWEVVGYEPVWVR